MEIGSYLVNYYKSIPIVSRGLFTLSVGLTLLTYLNVVSSYSLIYSFEYMKKMEFWRIFTSFFYWGPPNIDVFIHQVFLLRYSTMLEESFTNSYDYFYMIASGMVFIFGMGNVLKITKMSSALSSFITYVWTKKNPMIVVQYLGIVSMPAYYIPYVMCVFSFLVEKKIPKGDVVGILAGHTYFYFKTVFPKTSGRDPLGTPWFVRSLFEGKRERREEVNRRRIMTVDDIRREQ